MATDPRPTVAEAARDFLTRNRSIDGLGHRECGRLAALLQTATDESRILAKSARALSVALAASKEALLRCHAPQGDLETHAERQRVLGMIEDMQRGLVETDALRLRWIAAALAGSLGVPPEPPAGEDLGSGVLPFWRRPKG